MRLTRLLGTLAALLIAAPLAAATVDWPTRPVTVIAPFPPGGTVDIVARLIGQKLGAELGKPFVIENKSGAGGSIGTAAMVHAAPDGYTFEVNHMGLAFNAALYDNLGYDTLRDVVPVAYVGATPNVLVENNKFPPKTVAQFLALAKERPGTINYGSGGIGSAGHLPMELLQSATGIKLVHVPYKGNGPAIVDLISGQIQVMLATIPAMMPYITSGQLHAIATSGSHRSSALPDLPTLDEAGVKGFDVADMLGLQGPAGMSPAVVARLQSAIAKIMREPAMAERMKTLGMGMQENGTANYVQFMKDDLESYTKVIDRLGLRRK